MRLWGEDDPDDEEDLLWAYYQRQRIRDWIGYLQRGRQGMSKDHALGDAPIEEQLREHMNAIAFALDQILNGPEVVDDPSKRANGFVLMIFPYGEKEGRCNYISNGAGRDDIAKLFEEQAKKFREPPPS